MADHAHFLDYLPTVPTDRLERWADAYANSRNEQMLTLVQAELARREVAAA